jgi:hypothetical protein
MGLGKFKLQLLTFLWGLDDCPYASGARPTITAHRNELHHNHPEKGRVIEQVAVQYLFSGLAQKYFIISPELRGKSPKGAFSTLISNVLPKMPPLYHQTPPKSRDILPLHRVTRWWEILGSHALSKKGRNTIIALVGPVQKDERGLSMLPALCKEYLIEAQKASKSAGFPIRKRLVPEE